MRARRRRSRPPRTRRGSRPWPPAGAAVWRMPWRTGARAAGSRAASSRPASTATRGGRPAARSTAPARPRSARRGAAATQPRSPPLSRRRPRPRRSPLSVPAVVELPVGLDRVLLLVGPLVAVLGYVDLLTVRDSDVRRRAGHRREDRVVEGRGAAVGPG